VLAVGPAGRIGEPGPDLGVLHSLVGFDST
jgi:hypothetical protein